MKIFIPIIVFLALLLLNQAFLVFALFLATTVILYFIGKYPLIDLDPTPVAAAIVLILYGLPLAILYILITMPIADIITARFNQWTFINISSLLPALLIASFVESFAVIFIVLIIFNIVRFGISSFIGFRDIAIVSASSNTVSNSILISLFLPLVRVFG